MVKKKFYGTLARRIVLVLSVFVIVPLIVYSLLTWDRDWRIRLRAGVSQLDLIGKASLEILDQWIELRLSHLETVHDLVRGQEDISPLFQNPKILGNASTFFIFDQELVCLYSNVEEMVGEKNFFRTELHQSLSEGSEIFFGKNPYNQKIELFTLKGLGDQVWGLSTDPGKLTEVFTTYEEAGYPYSLSFVAKNFVEEAVHQIGHRVGGVFFSTTPDAERPPIKLLTLEAIQEIEGDLNSLRALRLWGKNLGLRISPPHANFDLVIEIPWSEIKTAEGAQFYPHLLLLVLLILLLGGLGTFWLIRRMSAPFDQLYEVMESVIHKKYSTRFVPDQMGFEINVLGGHFNDMLDSLIESMQREQDEKMAKELLEKELQIGRDLQKQLLPIDLPAFPHLSIGAGFIPAKEVAGDFYDLYLAGEERLFLAIADASDKGVSACFLSLIVRSIFRAHAQSPLDLGQIVKETNNLLCMDTKDSGDFVTAWVAFYDRLTGKLTYVCAGHNPALWIKKNGVIEELSTKGIALGVEKIDRVDVGEIFLGEQECLFLYTDGVVDAQNERGEFFGKNRLFEVLRSRGLQKPQQIIDEILKEVAQFSQNAPQNDDLTMLSVQTN